MVNISSRCRIGSPNIRHGLQISIAAVRRWLATTDATTDAGNAEDAHVVVNGMELRRGKLLKFRHKSVLMQCASPYLLSGQFGRLSRVPLKSFASLGIG